LRTLRNAVREDKVWGYEETIANGSYCGKLLVIYKGGKCSEHFHIHKDEVFYMLCGRVRMYLIYQDATHKEFIMMPGDILDVPPGLVHSFEGLDDDNKIIEVSTTHSSDDSYRITKSTLSQ